jgi:hypothetical protein
MCLVPAYISLPYFHPLPPLVFVCIGNLQLHFIAISAVLLLLNHFWTNTVVGMLLQEYSNMSDILSVALCHGMYIL